MNNITCNYCEEQKTEVLPVHGELLCKECIVRKTQSCGCSYCVDLYVVLSYPSEDVDFFQLEDESWAVISSSNTFLNIKTYPTFEEAYYSEYQEYPHTSYDTEDDLPF